MWRMGWVLLLLASPVAAEEWQVLTGPQIGAALSARVLGYGDGTMQDFKADGRTLYGDSWGGWQVRGDQYCSIWPPSDRWDCYAVWREGRGLEIRFVAASGEVTTGRYVDLR